MSTHNGIPDDFWRPVPCGHPPEPEAWPAADGMACHCGTLLNEGNALHMPGVGLLAQCYTCGCSVRIAKEDTKP